MFQRHTAPAGNPDIMSSFSRPSIEQPKFVGDVQQVRAQFMFQSWQVCSDSSCYSAPAAEAIYRLVTRLICVLTAEKAFLVIMGRE
jgi:hypothetical protein